MRCRWRKRSSMIPTATINHSLRIGLQISSHYHHYSKGKTTQQRRWDHSLRQIGPEEGHYLKTSDVGATYRKECTPKSTTGRGGRVPPSKGAKPCAKKAGAAKAE